MPPQAAELIAFAAVALALAVALAPATSSRRALLARGGVGLVGTAAIAGAPTFDLSLLVFAALAVAHAVIGGGRSFAVRLRAPILAVGLLALASAFARVQGPEVVHRFAAVGLAAGLAAAVGVVPYLHPFEPEEPVSASPVAWLAYAGPVAAVVFVAHAQNVLGVDAGAAFEAILIGVGIVIIAWGSLAAWWTENGAAAWRYSFISDWGLALAGFGIALPDGRRAAMLVLFAVVLCRLPLYIASRQSVRERVFTDAPINLLVAASLAGSAPFAGFAARVLLLRAATQVYWPLALVLAVGMLLWLPASLRLGRSLGVPRGKQAAGVAVVLALNVAVGLFPLPLLAVAGL